MICEMCNIEVDTAVVQYSQKNFHNKIFCRDCQKKVRGLNTKTTQSKQITQSSTISGIDKKHIININGKEFIKHAGLLDIAHKNGLLMIDTDMVECTDDRVIFKAKVCMPNNKVFTGYGDADKTNVNSQIALHKIRMAETRAVNRALRFATNIGMCSYEELGDANN